MGFFASEAPSSDGPGSQCTCSNSGQDDPYSTGGALRERFISYGALPVPGADGLTPNDARQFQNTPSCPDVNQEGLGALFEWTLGLSSRVVSDIRVEICPEVLKCQEEEDHLGQGMTVPIVDYRDPYGHEGPARVRLIHHRGSLWGASQAGLSSCACEDTTTEALIQPSLSLTPTGPPPWVPMTEMPEVHSNGVVFLGNGCTVITVPNSGYSALDFLTVQLLVPASTRVRVRAAADSVSACYIASPLPGQVD